MGGIPDSRILLCWGRGGEGRWSDGEVCVGGWLSADGFGRGMGMGMGMGMDMDMGERLWGTRGGRGGLVYAKVFWKIGDGVGCVCGRVVCERCVSGCVSDA